jgi:hypothetical protein
MITTFHTYPDLLLDGGRLAATNYGNHVTVSQAVDYITTDSDAIVLLARQGTTYLHAHKPGGMG